MDSGMSDGPYRVYYLLTVRDSRQQPPGRLADCRRPPNSQDLHWSSIALAVRFLGVVFHVRKIKTA